MRMSRVELTSIDRQMHETARKALEKHPKEPYIHYSLSASNQNYDEALRASKQVSLQRRGKTSAR